MVATPQLLQINTGFTGHFSLLLSNNANTGGTCFGDSGGPNFVGNSTVVGAVTSYAVNGNCAGTGGVFRVDPQLEPRLAQERLRRVPALDDTPSCSPGPPRPGRPRAARAKDPSIEGRRHVPDAQAVGAHLPMR